MQKNLRLIVFFVPPEKIVNGGILSIFSICKESRNFKDIHGAKVIISTYPNTTTYKKNDLFQNDETIYSFDEVVAMGIPEFLQLHVPEYASYDVSVSLRQYSDYLSKIPELRVNIMNQNILLMQKPHEVANWFLLTPNVTQTTAHNRYSEQSLADAYFLPTHHLSTFVDPSQYTWVPYEKKENIIAITLDEAKEKAQIVGTLAAAFPNYKIVTIENLRYEEYKDFISKTKFTITFGEGFDGYYVETFFTGGVAFAVYNDEFFPDKEFLKFNSTYSSYSEMLKNIVTDIKNMEDKNHYTKTVTQNLNKITRLYSFNTYVKNIKNFYLKRFSFEPRTESAKTLIAQILTEKERLTAEKDHYKTRFETTMQVKDKALQEKEELLMQKEEILMGLLNSYSWKITEPLRKLHRIFK
jgi:hypothetical protein